MIPIAAKTPITPIARLTFDSTFMTPIIGTVDASCSLRPRLADQRQRQTG